MDKFQQLTHYIHRMVSDDRLKPIHLSLILALCDACIVNRFQESCRVSRKLLMTTAHIKSRATYHKTIKELQVFGYLRYIPSYHPLKGSEVKILVAERNSMTDETN